MKFLIKYDNFLFESSNPDVLFYDKNGSWFSKGKLSDVNAHKNRFGENITFSVEGIEKNFSSIDEYKNYIKNNQPNISSNILFSEDEILDAKNRVKEKRKQRIDEGKTTQFFLKSILNVMSFLTKILKKIKVSKVTVKFKDERLEKQLYNDTIKLLDYGEFNIIKYYLFKRYNKKVFNFNKTFSEYVKEKRGVDLLSLSESILKYLKIENMELSDNETIKQKQTDTFNSLLELVKKIRSSIKLLDDSIIEERNITKQFSEIADILKKMKDNNSLELIKKGKDIADKSPSDNSIDDIIDKAIEYGPDSLTYFEKEKIKKL